MRAKISNLVKTIKKRQSGSCAAAQCPHSRQISSELQKWDCGQKLTALNPIGLARLLWNKQDKHIYRLFWIVNFTSGIDLGLIIIDYLLQWISLQSTIPIFSIHVDHACNSKTSFLTLPNGNCSDSPSRAKKKQMRHRTMHETT